MQSRDTVGQARVLHLAYTRREVLALRTIDSLFLIKLLNCSNILSDLNSEEILAEEHQDVSLCCLSTNFTVHVNRRTVGAGVP